MVGLQLNHGELVLDQRHLTSVGAVVQTDQTVPMESACESPSFHDIMTRALFTLELLYLSWRLTQ